MRTYILSLLVLYLTAKHVMGALDLTSYNPNNSNHVQALYNLQHVLQGYPQTSEAQLLDPSILQQLYNPNNPEHVRALNDFNSILNDNFHSPLLDVVKANPALAAQLGKTIERPSLFPTLPGLPAMPSVTSLLSPSAYFSAVGNYIRSWFTMKTLLTIVWAGLSFIFPPLVILTPVVGIALSTM